MIYMSLQHVAVLSRIIKMQLWLIIYQLLLKSSGS